MSQITCYPGEAPSLLLEQIIPTSTQRFAKETRESFKQLIQAMRDYGFLSAAVDNIRQNPRRFAARPERGFVFTEFYKKDWGTGRYVLPYTIQDEETMLPDRKVASFFDTWAEVPDLPRSDAMIMDFQVLTRGSVKAKFVDVFTGEVINGYGYQFLDMHAKIFSAARALHKDDFVARRDLMSRMLLLGTMYPRKWQVEELLRLASTPVMLTALRPLYESGELMEYLREGINLNYIAGLAGASIPA